MQAAAAKPDLPSILAADLGAVVEALAKEHGRFTTPPRNVVYSENFLVKTLSEWVVKMGKIKITKRTVEALKLATAHAKSGHSQTTSICGIS